MPFFKICARDSKLSRVQVEEALLEFPIAHSVIFIKTKGDLDKKTSLRELEKTDFFTKELDEMVLKKISDLAIHSAKDLPDPLPPGLAIFALTKGVDGRDALLFRDVLPKKGKIATSSLRREESVKKLKRDFECVDIRGTIEERVERLEKKEIDGLVIAKAALIRLKIDLPHIILEGEVPPLQGKLAIVGREGEKELFLRALAEGNKRESESQKGSTSDCE